MTGGTHKRQQPGSGIDTVLLAVADDDDALFRMDKNELSIVP